MIKTVVYQSSLDHVLFELAIGSEFHWTWCVFCGELSTARGWSKHFHTWDCLSRGKPQSKMSIIFQNLGKNINRIAFSALKLADVLF